MAASSAATAARRIVDRARVAIALFSPGSVRQRIGPQLEVRDLRPLALPALLMPRRLLVVPRPESPAFPAGFRVVDAAVEPAREEPERIRHAQHDELPVG